MLGLGVYGSKLVFSGDIGALMIGMVLDVAARGLLLGSGFFKESISVEEPRKDSASITSLALGL